MTWTPAGICAPPRVGMRTFQSFSGNASFEQGGDPTNDDERYQLLSASSRGLGPRHPPGRQADFRFLVSAGPFAELPPDESLTFQVGMVVGPGLGDAEGGPACWPTRRGLAHLQRHLRQRDHPGANPWTELGTFDPGICGRETMLCRQDFDEDVYENFVPDYMDTSCVDPEWLLGQPRLTDADMFDYEVDGDGQGMRHVQHGQLFRMLPSAGYPCESIDFETGPLELQRSERPDPKPAACTGIDGNETQISWLVGMAPPPPGTASVAHRRPGPCLLGRLEREHARTSVCRSSISNPTGSGGPTTGTAPSGPP